MRTGAEAWRHGEADRSCPSLWIRCHYDGEEHGLTHMKLHGGVDQIRVVR
jgi:hypothetical protein